MRAGYRTKVFLATFAVAAAVLVLASTMIAVSLRRQTRDRIERGLVSEARLAAELLSHRAAATSGAELRQEALALATGIEARVTLIAPDGRVLGDSSLDDAGLARVENHGTRPEVVEARARGIGVSSRSSTTIGVDMLYVAAAVGHPAIATVRLALPLTEVNRQVQTIWRAALYALGLSVVGAFAMAWVASALLVRRLNRLAVGARRYAAGEIPAPPADRGDDEIGTVSGVLERAVRQLGERAAEAARDRARIEAILAGMVEGVVVVDAHQRIQLVNAALRRMLRIEGDVAGRHVLECMRHPLVVSQLSRAMTGLPAEEAPGVIHEGGRAFVARAAPVPGTGGAVLVLHDITDLQRADQIRRDFVANVSHELRTPLTAIHGYIEALADQPVDPREQRRFLEIISRHTARMERLTGDLLRLARLESGQEPSDHGPCDVAKLFDDVVADLRPKLEQKRQRVQTAIDPSLSVITTDEPHLHDALRNLVENASVYSGDGTAIELGARLENDRVVITVADEGPGIPPPDLTRIFERFYRVDKARSRESGGTGLGLAIVKHIVERMNGSVRAENRAAGRGAVFTIELPGSSDHRIIGSSNHRASDHR